MSVTFCVASCLSAISNRVKLKVLEKDLCISFCFLTHIQGVKKIHVSLYKRLFVF